MSIEDRLTAGGAAWRESQPPVAVSPDPEVHRKPVLWLPLTAAAATVAVVLGASLLVSRDDSPAPLSSGVVPYAELRAGEADVPAPRGFADFPPPSLPAISDCEDADVGGRFAVLSHGRGRFTFTASGTRGCLLRSQAGVRVSTVTGRGGEFSTLAREPRLAGDAGGYPQRVLGQDPLFVDLDFSGQCLVAEGFTVEGIVPGVLRVAGTPVCADVTDDERFEAGPLHVAGEPHAPVPEDRAGLRVEIEVDGPAPTSGPLDYRVRLSNPTGEPISLDPCPAYRTGLYRKDSAGESYSGSGGRLNCDAAPDAVPAGGSVVFAMRHETTDPDGVPGPADVQAMSLRWAIAGPAVASADVPARTAEMTPTGAATPTPTASQGTVTSLRADLDDDGQPDVATIDSATGLVVVTTAGGELPALQLPASISLELQGVLPLSGTDGLLISTTSAVRTDQAARVVRIVDGQLVQLSDGDRPLLLSFVIGRGDSWAGIRCDEDGETFEVVTRAIIGGESLEVEETTKLLSIRGTEASFSERPSRRLPASSPAEAVKLAADARTRCPGLDAAGNGDVLGGSGP